jgi:hypothetical protein
MESMVEGAMAVAALQPADGSGALPPNIALEQTREEKSANIH